MSQTIKQEYNQPAKATTINEIHYKVIPPAVYVGGAMTIQTGNDVTVNNGLVAYVQDPAKSLSVRAQLTATSDAVTLTPNNCYVVARLSWSDAPGNVMTFHAVPYASILTSDVVIGRGEFVAGSVTGFDYSCQSKMIDQIKSDNHAFQVRSNPDPTYNNTVMVKAGRAWINETAINLAVDTTSVTIAPTTTNGRIDLITLTGAGVVNVVVGTPAGSPVAPMCPPMQLPLAYVTRGGSRAEINYSDITQITQQPGIYNFLPIGTILMYDGVSWVNDSTLKGWYKCDGSNGTPNLTDKFIMGAETSRSTGGANSTTLTSTQLPAHTHGMTHNHPTATTGAETGHTHQVYSATTMGSGGSGSLGNFARDANTRATGASSGHTHTVEISDSTTTVTTSTGTGSSYDSRPAYYTVIYVKRMS